MSVMIVVVELGEYESLPRNLVVSTINKSTFGEADFLQNPNSVKPASLKN